MEVPVSWGTSGRSHNPSQPIGREEGGTGTGPGGGPSALERTHSGMGPRGP